MEAQGWLIGAEGIYFPPTISLPRFQTTCPSVLTKCCPLLPLVPALHNPVLGGKPYSRQKSLYLQKWFSEFSPQMAVGYCEKLLGTQICIFSQMPIAALVRYIQWQKRRGKERLKTSSCSHSLSFIFKC